LNEKENNKNSTSVRKLLFLDESLIKKNDYFKVSNTLVFTQKDNNQLPNLEIQDLRVDINEKKDVVIEEKTIVEEKNEELIRSQRLIDNLKHPDFVTLYDRNKKCSKGEEKPELKSIEKVVEVVKPENQIELINLEALPDKPKENREDDIIFVADIAETKKKNGEIKQLEGENNELDNDDHLSELSQFLKDAGLLTTTKESIPTENLPRTNHTGLSVGKIVISQNSQFEIPSRQTVTPVSLKQGKHSFLQKEYFRNNTADLQGKT
jgi:hypothetical protein